MLYREILLTETGGIHFRLMVGRCCKLRKAWIKASKGRGSRETRTGGHPIKNINEEDGDV